MVVILVVMAGNVSFGPLCAFNCYYANQVRLWWGYVVMNTLVKHALGKPQHHEPYENVCIFLFAVNNMFLFFIFNFVFLIH